MKTKAISILFLLAVYLSSSFAQISPNSDQLSAYQQLNEKYQNSIELNWHKTNGSPEIISFDIPVAFSNDQKESAYEFLKEIKKLLDYRTNKDTLILLRTNENKGRKYFRFQQWYKGVRVKGGEYVVTVLQDGNVKTALGSFYKNINIETNPQISSGEALQTALKNPPEGKQLKDLALSSELIIYTKENINYLAYELHVAGEREGESWRYIIDASNRNVLELTDDVMHTSQANVYLRHPGLDASYTTISPLQNLFGNGYLQGTYANILNEDISRAYNANNDFRYSTGDTHFDEANLYYHVDKIAAYFRDFGFDEFTQITAHAHYGSYSFHTGYNPNDHHIRFTDEQVTDYHSAAREDKVIYHEYTHAVSDYIAGLSSTHDETGAINEGNSDYFAGSFTGRSLINEYFSYIEEINQRDMTDPRIADFTEFNNDDYYWVDGEYWGYQEPHFGGELWSACLWDIRDDLDSTIADRIIYDGLYAIPSNSTFLQYRKAILDADVFDYNGSHLNTIAHDFYLRGIGNDVQTVSGTLQSSQTWSQYVQLSGNVYVPSGKTLTIASTATVNLLNGGSRYSIISTGGTITKGVDATINGLAATIKSGSDIKGLCCTVQSACSNASDHNQIIMTSGTHTENVTINNKDFIHLWGPTQGWAILDGQLTVYSSIYTDISSFSCNKINFSYSEGASLVDASVVGSGTNGIHFISSDYFNYYGGIISNFANGILTAASDGEVYGWIEDNNNGIRADGSYIDVKYNTSLCGTNNYDLYSGRNSHIEAWYCYFNNGTPVKYGDVVIHTAYNCNSLAKQGVTTNENFISGNFSNTAQDNEKPAIRDYKSLVNSAMNLSRRIKTDISDKRFFDENKFNNEFISISEDFKKYIEDYPESEFSKSAIRKITGFYAFLKDYEGMYEYLNYILKDNNLANLHSAAKHSFITYYSEQKDFENAIKTADELLKTGQIDNNLAADVLFTKGEIYLYDLNNPDKAIECFTSLVENYPDELSITEYAKDELRLLGYDTEENEKQVAYHNLGFSTSSYPNPFNPITVIKYSLPSDEKVTIKVYDILGRETAVLVNEYKTAGEYSINFDGSNLASGVYFYSFKAGKFSQTKKMILAK